MALPFIPFAGDDPSEAKRTRTRWVDFFRQKRANWNPGKTAVICSKHVAKEDFERRFTFAPDEVELIIPHLRRDDCLFAILDGSAVDSKRFT